MQEEKAISKVSWFLCAGPWLTGDLGRWHMVWRKDARRGQGIHRDSGDGAEKWKGFLSLRTVIVALFTKILAALFTKSSQPVAILVWLYTIAIDTMGFFVTLRLPWPCLLWVLGAKLSHLLSTSDSRLSFSTGTLYLQTGESYSGVCISPGRTQIPLFLEQLSRRTQRCHFWHGSPSGASLEDGLVLRWGTAVSLPPSYAVAVVWSPLACPGVGMRWLLTRQQVLCV